LLCTDKDPFEVAAKEGGPVTAATEQITVTAYGVPTDGNQADAPVIGQAIYTVDLGTMKISTVTCH
jgi:hypothetical protein